MTCHCNYRHLLSPLVEVTVGEGHMQKVYQLHASLLCEVSQFFRGCLSGHFSEASSLTIPLSDHDPNAFAWFVRWTYTGEIGPFGDRRVHSVMEMLVDVYFIADRLMCPGLKSRTMDMMQDASTQDYISVEALVKVARSEYRKSKLATYLVEQVAYDLAVRFATAEYTDSQDWPTLLTANGCLTSGLMLEMVRLKECNDGGAKPADPQYGEGCHWHEHEENKDLKCKRWPVQRDTEWAFGLKVRKLPSQGWCLCYSPQR